jgi:hypothetical protein
MGYTPNGRIDTQLNGARQAIDAALSYPELESDLLGIGYTRERLEEGKQHYQRAFEQQRKFETEHDELAAAQAALEEVWERVADVYMPHLDLARIAFDESDDVAQRLGLRGRRKSTLSGKISQAEAFYVNALRDSFIQEGLARFGVTREQLEAGNALVQEQIVAVRERDRELGDAHQATAARDEALEQLADWMNEFMAATRVAFRKNPHQLDKLGLNH